MPYSDTSSILLTVDCCAVGDVWINLACSSSLTSITNNGGTNIKSDDIGWDILFDVYSGIALQIFGSVYNHANYVIETACANMLPDLDRINTYNTNGRVRFKQVDHPLRSFAGETNYCICVHCLGQYTTFVLSYALKISKTTRKVIN